MKDRGWGLHLLSLLPQAILLSLSHWLPWLDKGSETVRKMAPVYLALLGQQASSPVSFVIRGLFALYQLSIASVCSKLHFELDCIYLRGKISHYHPEIYIIYINKIYKTSD